MTRRIRQSGGRQRQDGVAMVEFMIVLPLILFLMFAVTEVGRMIMRHNTLSKSVQDGARYAAAFALLGTTGTVYIDAALDSETRNLVVYGDVQGGTPLVEGLSIGQVQLTSPQAGWVQVQVVYPYVPAFGSVIPNFGVGSSPNFSVDLTATVMMRAL